MPDLNEQMRAEVSVQEALGDLRQAKAALDAIEAVNSRRGTPEHHAAAARYQAAVDALVLAALSRRPAAAAEELVPQDVSVLRRWAEQIERMASVFNDERSLLCKQAAILLHRIAYRPAEVAAEQPAAEPELLPLPEPLEIDWPQLHSVALGCGVEDRNIHDRYEAAEYGWQDGMDKAAERVPNEIYTADQMHAYARAHLRAAGQGKDSERLEFVLSNTAWVTWVEFDSTFKRAQLWTQDDDENYIVLSGDDKSFATAREAIDAAMKAGAQGGTA